MFLEINKLVSTVNMWVFRTSRLSKGTATGIRDAAWVGVCFFGVRRSAETILLHIEDLNVEEDSVSFFIRRQKNDPFGAGMRCHIARAPQFGEMCPVKLLLDWIKVRDSLWPSMRGVGPLFCTTQSHCRPISYDSLRKTVAHFYKDKTVGTHSFRKG